MALPVSTKTKQMTQEEKDFILEKAMTLNAVKLTLLYSIGILSAKEETLLRSIRQMVRNHDAKMMNDAISLTEKANKKIEDVSARWEGAIFSVDKESYNSLQDWSYEITRLVMFYFSRAKNPQAAKSIEKAILRLHGTGPFTDEEMSSIEIKYI